MVDVNILNERKRKVDHVAIVTSIFDYCSPRWKIFREVLFKLRGGGGRNGRACQTDSVANYWQAYRLQLHIHCMYNYSFLASGFYSKVLKSNKNNFDSQ